MPSSKKKKEQEMTDSPQASTSEDAVGVEDVSTGFGTRSNSRFARLEHVDEMQTSFPYVTEDKIQDMFANLQAGLLITLHDELDKRDRRQPTLQETTNEPKPETS